jgi:hypothetical protein
LEKDRDEISATIPLARRLTDRQLACSLSCTLVSDLFELGGVILGCSAAGDTGRRISGAGLIEVEVAACLLAAAIVAFTFIVGHTLWMSLACK